MPRVKVLVLGQTGGYVRRRTVQKATLATWSKVRFHGEEVYVSPRTSTRIRTERPPITSAEVREGGMLPAPPRGGGDISTEIFFVRDDYKGGRRIVTASGKRKRTAPAQVDFRVVVTGTRQERNDAFSRLQETFLSSMPFLARKGTTIGRDRYDGPRPSDTVKVLKSVMNHRPKPDMGRAVYFDLKEVA